LFDQVTSKDSEDEEVHEEAKPSAAGVSFKVNKTSWSCSEFENSDSD
jgi:hypothetical protein